MNSVSYRGYFSQAFANPLAIPYDYQCRLACGPDAKAADESTLQNGVDCRSQLIEIPTGLGKTAAVVLAWLWNRVLQPDLTIREKWPRRLVYCLPMRTLVEQTRKEAEKWLKAHSLFWDGEGSHQGRVGLHILMGGEDSEDWNLYPQENAILIGTQDMLLSQALNRGYSMSRYRWPMHFGLLNNDCLWVMDETQLMGPGLNTACQLEAFRGDLPRGFGSFGEANSVTWYMSATNNPEHLMTREWRGVTRSPEFEFRLSPEEKSATSGPIHQRRHAVKSLELEPALSLKDSTATQALAATIVNRHLRMATKVAAESALPTRTLIICNTVDRAIAVYKELRAKKPDEIDLHLLHSRFRPPQRREQMERLDAIASNEFRAAFPKGQIVVATQVIEAGVDLSSGILWTEVAPLASLVQRLGRLNRAGEFNSTGWRPVGILIGVGVEAAPPKESKDAERIRQKDNSKCCLPYELAASEAAWAALQKLEGDASPASLEQIQSEISASISRCKYSLQRHEMLDFFDTGANLSLGFTDVSPFVRGLDNDTDIQLLWRESWLQKDGREGIGEPGFAPEFQRDEFCSVPIGKAKVAREILNHGWLWRGKESGWASVRDVGISPSMTILLPCEAGGYDNDTGWTGENDDNRHASHHQQRQTPSEEEHLSSLANGWQSIAVHTAVVEQELSELLQYLLLGEENEREALMVAVPWHDIGKNMPDWQQAAINAIKSAGITGKEAHQPFAKFSLADSPLLTSLVGDALKKRIRELRNSFRPGIAHEVASALAFRQAEQKRLGPNPEIRDTDLVSLLAEYVIISHHGRVRKVLRDEIPKFPKSRDDTNTVRGIAHGEPLPPVVIDGQNLGCESISTDCRRMGREANSDGSFGHEGYTRGVLRLLEHYGPFRLAYFEAIFRAADVRASIKASHEHKA